MWGGLDPAPCLHTPSNRQGKRGLGGSSACGDSEGRQSRLLSTTRSWRRFWLSLPGQVGALQVRCQIITHLHTSLVPRQRLTALGRKACTRPGLPSAAWTLARGATFNSSCSLQGTKPKHQTGASTGSPALSVHRLSKQRTLTSKQQTCTLQDAGFFPQNLN